MKQIMTGIVAGVLLATALPAVAEHGVGHWAGHDIHHFGERDFGVWRGGHWYHGPHGGQLGWWWVAAGVWYFYPAPIYPYPDPYIPSITVINPQPPVVVAPQTEAPAQPQPAAQLWYYCDSAKGYYPYVANCQSGWRTVPAQPPQAPPR